MKVKRFFVRLRKLTKKHKWLILLVFTAICVGGFFIWDSYTATTDLGLAEIIIPQKKELELFPAPYSGLMVEEGRLNVRPIAVMIENHPDSRPQSGLNEADIVYETFAEGGITRFLAIYQSQKPKEIGPVRSARPYYVEWADSYNALYAHIGGSVEGLNLINTLGVSDLNQFSLGSYFWRDNSRWAPHNVYTTVDKLMSAADSKGYETTDNNILGYQFKDDIEEELRSVAQKFTVNFNYSYGPTYTYNVNCNCYYRSLVGVKQIDKNTKERIQAKNVVIVFSSMGSQRVRNSTYTTIKTTGTGKAYIYLDGKKITGIWKRVNGKPIRFYDANVKEIKLNRGTTWIDIVPTGTTIK